MAEILVAAGASAGAAGGAAAGASSLGTIISLGMTGASAFGQIMAGQAQAASMKFQARQSELQAKAEEIKGRQQSLEIKQRLERDTASAIASFASRGLQSSGSSLAALAAGKERATQDIDTAMFNTDMNVATLRGQAQQSRIDARSAKTSGYFGALGTVASNKRVISLLED